MPERADTEPARSSRIWILAVILGVAAFLPSLRYPLLLDDVFHVAADPRILPPLDFERLLLTPLWEHQFPAQPLWRPLVHLSLALNRMLLGESAAGFRIVNLLLHGAVAGLVWLLVLVAGGSRRLAGFAAVLFALHPVHTEAVVGIVGRAELMTAAGVLLTVWLGMRASERSRIGWVLAAGAAYALALFSKEQGYLAIVLWGLVWLVRKAGEKHRHTSPGSFDPPDPSDPSDSPATFSPSPLRWRDAVLVALLLLSVALVGLSLRARLFGFQQDFRPANLQPLDNPLVEVEDPGVRAATALRIFGRAVALSLLPLNLSPDYSSPGVPVGWQPLTLTVVSGLMLLVLLGVLIATAIRAIRGKASSRERLIALGVAWFLLTFLPVSNLFVLNGTIFGERLLYLPSVGVCLLLGIALERVATWYENRRVPKPRTSVPKVISAQLWGFVGVAILLGWCWTAQRPWRSEQAFFEQVIEVVPRSAKGHYGLALALKAQGDLDAAHDELVVAVGLWPRYAKAWHELGLLALAEGNRVQAERYLRRALKLDPHLSESHNSLGNVLAMQGRYEEALRQFQIYRKLGPKDPDALERKIQHTHRQLKHPPD